MGIEPDTPKGGLVPNALHALPASLARAMRFLEGRLDEPIQLDTLAAAAGVRPRTLEAHFRAYLGTTPLGWLRRQRLARARQQLLAADNRNTVTDVALANGFTELGRFAAQYRGQFGELPSRTLRAARSKQPNPPDELADEALRLSGRALISAFTVGPGPCSAAIADPNMPRSWHRVMPYPKQSGLGAGASAQRIISAKRRISTARTRCALPKRRRVSDRRTRWPSACAVEL